jgi:hypothetical protein
LEKRRRARGLEESQLALPPSERNEGIRAGKFGRDSKISSWNLRYTPFGEGNQKELGKSENVGSQDRSVFKKPIPVGGRPQKGR